MEQSNAMKIISLFCLVMLGVKPATSSFPFHSRKTEELIGRLERKMEASDQMLASSPESTSNALKQEQEQGRVFFPANYGADVTGQKDSSDSIMQALNAAVKSASTGLKLLPEITDLGGVVIDLQGGSYLISKPIRFPSKIGNLLFKSGTLRARNAFPANRFLVELQSDQKPGASMSYEDITFRDILFDSKNNGGGLILDTCARIRVTNCFFLHFTTTGLLVQGGHETFVSNCFLGYKSTVGADPDERNFKGTAIDLHGNDNAVTDVAIFSAAVGISVNGLANVITGVHCYNKATGWGGVGIAVNVAGLSQTRIHNCYMDYTSIVLVDPVQVVVSNGFFLGDANIVLKAKSGVVSGLTIVNNMFSGRSNPIVEVQGSFKNIDQVSIEANNVNGGMSLRSSVGRKRVQVSGKNWTVDFSPILVFLDRIMLLQYSFFAGKGVNSSGFPILAVTSTSNNSVIIQSDVDVEGEVSVEVRQ